MIDKNIRKHFVILILLVFSVVFTNAQNFYSTNGNQGSVLWNNAGTWDVAGIPNLASNTLNITINYGDTVTSTAALEFKKETTLIVKSGAHLILDAGATIDILEVAKNFTIIVEDGGILHVNGNINAAKEATFDITGDVGITGDVNFNGTPPGSITVTDPGILNVGGIIDGVIPSGTGTTTQNHPDPLPIELTSFKVSNNNNRVVVSWQTASELNNDYFTIERSADAVNYKVIGTVNGSGNSSVSLNYTFTDRMPLNGVSYYRLKQTDYNGDFEIFNPVSISYINDDAIHIGPNPAHDNLNIILNGEMGVGNIIIYNMIGAQVKNLNLESNYTTINISDLPSGTYMVSFLAAKKQITKRIIVQ